MISETQIENSSSRMPVLPRMRPALLSNWTSSELVPNLSKVKVETALQYKQQCCKPEINGQSYPMELLKVIICYRRHKQATDNCKNKYCHMCLSPVVILRKKS